MDVIAQLSSKKIRAREGVYLIVDGMDHIGDDDAAKSAKEVFDGASCEACALGSLFVSSVRIKNGLLATEALDEDEVYDPSIGNYRDVVTCDTAVMRSRLSEYFDPLQVDLIESAFEKSDMVDPDEGDAETEGLVTDAITFGEAYERPVDRMRAIMQNIIDHRGTFVP